MKSPQPYRSQKLGLVLIVSSLLIAASCAWAISHESAAFTKQLIRIPLLSSLVLFEWGRRMRKRGYQQSLAGADAAPIVYLRSFSSDVGDEVVHPTRDILGTLMCRTNETQFARAALGLAPFVAVGDPRDKLEPLGADRIYVPTGTNWQVVVGDLVSRSELVIVRAGAAKGGLLWELEHVTRNVAPQNLLIFLPYPERQPSRKRDLDYKQFVATAAPVFPKGLLRSIDKELFIAFGPDWTPFGVTRDGLTIDPPLPMSTVGREFLIRMSRTYQDRDFRPLRALRLLVLLGLILVAVILMYVLLGGSQDD